MKTAGILAVVAAAAAFVCAEPARRAYEASVVSLAVTVQGTNEERPWSKTNPADRTALAAVVDGGYLLTTAQMIENATLVEAEKNDGAPRAKARVVRVDPDANLALLAVDDKSFFDGLKPVVFAAASPADGTVRQIRLRNGQTEVSASRITRVEGDSAYMDSLEHPFLFLVTDLPDGGWSEPVFADEKLVGLTASQDGQTARVIPVEILAPFVERARTNGAYRRFANLGVRWSSNEDPALAAYLGQTGAPSGVVITKVPRGATGCGELRVRDILLGLDGRAIDARGYFVHPRFGRLRFPSIVALGHAAGDVVPARVLRGGKEIELKITLKAADESTQLMPWNRWDDPPPYLQAGGIIFRELDGPYLRTWGDDWWKKADVGMLTLFRRDRDGQTAERRRVIIVAGVLPLNYNLGYYGATDEIVASVNGRPVDSVAAVAEALKHPEGAFDRIVLAPSDGVREIVLDAAGLDGATAEARRTYGLPNDSRLRATPLPDLGPACE